MLTASAAFAAALQIQGLAIMNNSEYVPERYQAMLVFWLILVYAAVMNIWGHKLLPSVNLLSGKTNHLKDATKVTKIIIQLSFTLLVFWQSSLHLL